MPAYYNENDKFAAAWLRLLIKEKAIADGEVDERSIEEVQPEDLCGFTQCHFFAGIGIWSYALRLAGWPDDRPVWTGSCPCPSFSAAGQGKGFDDPRHLWPAWSRLIRECKPATIFGEQVDDAIGYGWLDLVQTDLEREAYSVGKAVFGACSVGAPQIGSRLYFVAEAAGSRRQEERKHGGGMPLLPARPEQRSGVSSMASTDGRESRNGNVQRGGKHGLFAQDGGAGELEQAERRRCEQRNARERSIQESDARSTTDGLGPASERGFGMWLRQRRTRIANGREELPPGGPGPTNGFWRDAEWLYCTDGKYRPVEPGTFPLAHGYPNRVGVLRGYGNALCAPQATEFIKAVMECL